VALIVKADDFGVYLAGSGRRILRRLGRSIVSGMPFFLNALSFVGMLAMLWVGGGILTHGLHEMGVHGPEETIHHAASSVAEFMPSLASFMTWLASAGIAAILGILIGAFVDLTVKHFLAPAYQRLKSSVKASNEASN
jgi:predicted DNA repair protein MutK